MPQRSTAERGWRLAALLLLGVVAFFWMPLGVRDASGVSSVIPALRPSTQSRPDRPDRPAAARPRTDVRAALAAARRAITAVVAVVGLAPVLVLVGLALAAAAAALPRPPGLGRLRSRAPPAVP